MLGILFFVFGSSFVFSSEDLLDEDLSSINSTSSIEIDKFYTIVNNYLIKDSLFCMGVEKKFTIEFLQPQEYDESKVFEKQIIPVGISEVITPNGDGVNDEWEIPMLDDFFDDIHQIAQIFNEKGRLVYKLENCVKGQTFGGVGNFGKMKGVCLKTGIYYYVLATDGNEIYRGSLYIVNNRLKK